MEFTATLQCCFPAKWPSRSINPTWRKVLTNLQSRGLTIIWIVIVRNIFHYAEIHTENTSPRSRAQSALKFAYAKKVFSSVINLHYARTVNGLDKVSPARESASELIPRASSSPEVTLDSRVTLKFKSCKSNSCENATCETNRLPAALTSSKTSQRPSYGCLPKFQWFFRKFELHFRTRNVKRTAEILARFWENSPSPKE